MSAQRPPSPQHPRPSTESRGHHRSASDASQPITTFGFSKPSTSRNPSGTSSKQELKRSPSNIERHNTRTMADLPPAPHKSSSKTGLNRLYDSKSSIRTATVSSGSSLSLPTSTISSSSLSTLGSTDNPWQTLHVYVLPLFNGEPLGQPIENLNALVRQHIKTVISNGFSRALGTLEADIVELLSSGMLTLSSKLSGVEDERLLARTAEIWGHFFCQVLPYIEGVFLPAHTDALLLSLHRPKVNRSTSPTLSDLPSRPSSGSQIDVRTLTLRVFRDAVVLPIYRRLYELLYSPRKALSLDNSEHIRPQLQQMLLVLSSICSTPPSSSKDGLHDTIEGGHAVAQLLQAVRNPPDPQRGNVHRNISRISTFISAGPPRDRRGRIARKSIHVHHNRNDEENDDGSATPRNGSGLSQKAREREILATLRNPNLDNNRASVGGWGLGEGKEEKVEDEDEDEDLAEWDKLKMDAGFVGLKAGEVAQDGRRKIANG